MEEPGQIKRAVINATAGAISGAVSRTVTSPLDVIKIRFQVQLEPTSSWALQSRQLYGSSKYTGILQATKDILKEEGLPVLLLPLQLITSENVVDQYESCANSVQTFTQFGSRVIQFTCPSRLAKHLNDLISVSKSYDLGFFGFWRGNVPALLMVMPYTAIQFTVLHKIKTFASGSSKTEEHIKLSPYLSYISGAVAGCAATVGSYPFDLVRTILASQGEPKVYSSMRSAFVGIYKTRGIQGLYTGLSPTLVEIIPYAGLQFGTYDMFKRWMMSGNRSENSVTEKLHPKFLVPASPRWFMFSLEICYDAAWNRFTDSSQSLNRSDFNPSSVQLFLCGLASGTVAKLACHPLDVVKKRFQVEGLQRHPRYGARVEPHAYRGMYSSLHQILLTEGWMGLYKGIVPSIIKSAPSSAVTFVAYEYTSDLLQSMLT
ncbi:hypothetical protein Syun_007863 [Stephania yunnanensis]|uniref:Mitochondrial carrier protein n=1 Tax=Stephania yunnanensis TaxID=152371 RepID=A0AAP0L0X8_9MAGN